MRRALLGLLFAAGGLSAQIRLDSLDALASKAKESVNVTLSGPTIQLLKDLAKNGKEGDQAMALLSGLTGITVRQFEFKGRNQYSEQDLGPVKTQLSTAEGWNSVVNVKDGDESATVYMRTQQGRNTGFAIIAAEPSELTVVVIDGTVDLAALQKLGGAFGIPDISGFMPNQLKQDKQDKQDKKGKEE